MTKAGNGHTSSPPREHCAYPLQCRKDREGPQVWYPANTAHLSTYSYIPWYTTYIWVYTSIYRGYQVIYWYKILENGWHTFGLKEWKRLLGRFARERPAWRGGRHFLKADSLPLLSLNNKASMCVYTPIYCDIRTYTTSIKYILVYTRLYFAYLCIYFYILWYTDTCYFNKVSSIY